MMSKKVNGRKILIKIYFSHLWERMNSHKMKLGTDVELHISAFLRDIELG